MPRLSAHGIIAVITGDAFLIRKPKKQILRTQLGRMLTYKQLQGVGVGRVDLSKQTLRWAASAHGQRRRKEEPVKDRGLEPFASDRPECGFYLH